RLLDARLLRRARPPLPRDRARAGRGAARGDGGHRAGARRPRRAAGAARRDRGREDARGPAPAAPPARIAAGISFAAVRIGVAKEIKADEYRVALTPAGALELVNAGHQVQVEAGAGVGSSFPDEAYERVGARIASVDEVWERSDLVLKVKEPI